MKKTSIRIKTLAYLSLFSAAILLLLWVFQVQFFGIFFEKYTFDTIEKVVKVVKLTEEENLNQVLEEQAFKNNICIQIYETTDNLIKKQEGFNIRNVGCILGINDFKIKPYNEKEIEGDSYVILENPSGIKSIIYKVIINENKYALINTTLEDISTTSLLLKNQLLYIVLLLIILSIIISIFISRQFNKPIINLTNQAKELGKGNYHVKFDESDVKELNELSKVLTVAASEMNKTDELRRDLIANVSHDLKTPLTMIKAYAEKVRDLSYKNDEIRTKDLNVIIDESDRLNNLVNDILDLSKIEANKTKLNITKYDLIEEIKDVLKRYEIVKEVDKYKIETNLPSSVIVKADRNKMDQVFYNLINNAIEHTGKDLKIKIDVRVKKDEVIVSITDTGKGIKKEEIPLVWNRYYTKEKKYKRNIVGTGIGLSIVKGIFEEHKIEYGIDSKVGKYTTFYFKLRISK